MRKYAVLAAVLIAVAACQDSTSPRPVAVMPAGVNAAKDVGQNDYIVVLRDDESDPDGQRERSCVKIHGGPLKHVYKKALKGFAVSNLSDAPVEALADEPRVASIERDGIMTVDAGGTETGATWGLDRVDHRLPLNGTYGYDTKMAPA